MANVKISNKAVAGMWYISNSEKTPNILYLWKDLQWHEGTVDDYRNYEHNAFGTWPGYYETEEEANDTYKRYVDQCPENQSHGTH